MSWCVCVRACVHACVCACVCLSVCMHVYAHARYNLGISQTFKQEEHTLEQKQKQNPNLAHLFSGFSFERLERTRTTETFGHKLFYTAD